LSRLGGMALCGARLRNSRNVPAVDFRRYAHALALPRGRTEDVAPLAFTYSIVKQRCALRRVNELHSGKGISAPVLLLGAGIRPTSAFFLPPRGSARHKAHDPGYPGSVRECVAPGRARV